MKQLDIVKCIPYLKIMRLDKPVGILLLLWPTLWALWIAQEGFPPGRIISIFVLGTVVMRSAGCIINDMADRDLDGAVARTVDRPLVTGSLSVTQAFGLFLSLCTIGFTLVYQLNLLSLKLSVVALALAVIYPFTKRLTYLPQVVLGAAFAWSIPMAFAAIQNKVPLTGWLLFIIAVIWPIAYDSIYALMDRDDDIKIGIKSTAILFGEWDIAIICLLQLLFIVLMALLGIWIKAGIAYFIAITIALGMIYYQFTLIRRRNIQNYYRAFYNNHWLGCVLFLGISFNYLI